MPKVMHIDVMIELPGDEWAEAAQKVALKPAWDAFASALTEAGIKFQASLDTVAVRAKPATTGAKRGRKAKQPPAIVPSTGMFSEPDDGEAA